MAEGNGNFWDPYCPCKVTRKNIVMTCLAILCFILVFWTIIETSHVDDLHPTSNTTKIPISSKKSLAELELE